MHKIKKPKIPSTGINETDQAVNNLLLVSNEFIDSKTNQPYADLINELE